MIRSLFLFLFLAMGLVIFAMILDWAAPKFGVPAQVEYIILAIVGLCALAGLAKHLGYIGPGDV